MKQAFAILILLRRSEGNGKATICLRNVATCTMCRTNFKQQVGTLRKFLMFKIKNLLQLAVPNAATELYRSQTSGGMNVLDFY